MQTLEVNMPPIGIIPYRFWIEKRVTDLIAAIERYTDAEIDPLPEWFSELNSHLNTLRP